MPTGPVDPQKKSKTGLIPPSGPSLGAELGAAEQNGAAPAGAAKPNSRKTGRFSPVEGSPVQPGFQPGSPPEPPTGPASGLQPAASLPVSNEPTRGTELGAGGLSGATSVGGERLSLRKSGRYAAVEGRPGRSGLNLAAPGDALSSPASGLRPATGLPTPQEAYLNTGSGLRPATSFSAPTDSYRRLGSGLRGAVVPSAPAGPNGRLGSGLRKATDSAAGSAWRQAGVTAHASPSSSRISLGVGAVQAWCCGVCNVQLSKEALMQGGAELRDGKLWCAGCLAKARSLAVSGRTRWSLVLGMLALFAAASLFFLGQVLFLVIMASAGAVLVGVIGLNLRTRTRVLLTGGGAAAVAACLLALSHLQERSRSVQEASRYAPEVEAIESLLGEDKLLEAHKNFLRLWAQGRGLRGSVTSTEAERALQTCASAFEDWYRSRYGDMGDGEKEILRYLLSHYPEKTVSGARRFSALRLDKQRFGLKVLLEAQDPGGKDWVKEAVDVAACLFQDLPALETLDLSLSAVEANRTVHALGTFQIPHSQIEAIVLHPDELVKHKKQTAGPNTSTHVRSEK